MEKLLIVLSLWITSLPTMAAEKYYVTFVKGDVTLERTKAKIKVGDALNPEDKLVFIDKTAKVSCISPGKGRFDIKAQGAKPGNKGELLAVLKNSLVPASGTYHLSTRSLMFEGYDPKTYFYSAETNNHILLIANEALPVNPSYKMDDTNFFFLQYKNKDQTETKKLQHSSNGLIFHQLLSPGVEKVMLCYQSNVSGAPRSAIIAEFYPVIVSRADIQHQIKLLKDFSGVSDPKKLKKEILFHLFQNYGKIGEEVLSTALGL